MISTVVKILWPHSPSSKADLILAAREPQKDIMKFASQTCTSNGFLDLEHYVRCFYKKLVSRL